MLIPRLSLRSNLGLELANAFSVFIRYLQTEPVPPQKDVLQKLSVEVLFRSPAISQEYFLTRPHGRGERTVISEPRISLSVNASEKIMGWCNE